MEITQTQAALSAVAAIAGVLAGSPLARYAARRSAAQPVALEPAAERHVLSAVAAEPWQYLRLHEMRPHDYADPANQAVWARLEAMLSMVEKPPVETPDEKVEELLVRSRATHAEVYASLEMRTLFDAAGIAGEALDAKRLIDEASKVVAASEDRHLYNGGSPIVAGGPGEASLVRALSKPSRARRVFASTVLASAGSLSVPLAVTASYEVPAQILAAASLLVLSVASLVWALVDYDTMYLDTGSFWPGLGASWALAAAAAFAEHDPRRLLPGAAIAIGGAVVFEVANFLYRLIRGRDGMGGGDTLILLATAGVPAALFGSWQLGYAAGISSLALGIVGWLVLALRGKMTRTTPYAFGPYLALGWIVATTVCALS